MYHNVSTSYKYAPTYNSHLTSCPDAPRDGAVDLFVTIFKSNSHPLIHLDQDPKAALTSPQNFIEIRRHRCWRQGRRAGH